MSKVVESGPADAAADLAALNQLRLEDDLTYADLGELIGIDAGALYRILNGQSEPIDRTLFKIRRYLRARSATESAKRPRKEKRARRVSLEA